MTVLVAVLLAGCSGPKESTRPVRVAAALPPPPVASSPSHAGPIWPESAPQIHAKAAILIDARNGRVLYQKNADERRQVASTQKLLTALIIAERESLDGVITIEPSDTRVEPTKLGLRPGDRYPRRKLLASIMIKSSNDATAALGRDHAGSIEAFAAEMNSVARSFGANDSYFVNPHGLPANQFSTTRDIARIAFRAYRNPDLRQMMRQQVMIFQLQSGRSVTLKATNDLLKKSPAFNGMKTGYTVAAGRCLVASVASGGRELIFVQLGSQTRYIFDDAERMLRWGLAGAGSGY